MDLSLIKGHPRLYLDTTRRDELKRLLESDELFQQLADRLTRVADSLIDSPATEFRIEGPRMLKRCQQIRDRVVVLALVFHLRGDKKYADRAKIELFAAADFPHWNPNHFLDTAELCTAFGIGYDWLYHVLNQNEKTCLKKALLEKGLLAGLAEYNKKAWWLSANNNWNVVCHGGLSIGALAIADEEPEIAGAIFETAQQNIPIVLREFEPDGAWPAGPEYWEYTTRYCALFFDALSTAGLGLDHFDTTGLAKSGLFPLYCAGPLDLYFNFADADPESVAKPSLFWLGDKYNLPHCSNENHRLLQKQLEERETVDAFNLVWYRPFANGLADLPRAAYFRGTETVFMRSEWQKPGALFLAAKGGSNQADHAHLDLGSFVLDAGGLRWAVDLGRDNYDLPGYWDMTEGGGRWSYFRLNNKSHNTLTLNDDVQRAAATAHVVRHHFSSDLSFAIFDLTQAYKPHALSVQRGFALIGEQVIIQDEIVWAGEEKNACWNLVTDAEIVIVKNQAMLKKSGQTMAAKIISPAGVEFVTFPAAQKPPEMPNNGFSHLKINVPAAEAATTICVALANKVPDFAPLPLADWSNESLRV